MSFTLNALVHNASDTLIDTMRTASRLNHVSRNGTLVIRALSNREASAKQYPAEWQDTGGPGNLIRYRPVFDSGTVHEVFTLPAGLEEIQYKLVFDEAETHLRGLYCQLITGYNGEKLRPYRRQSANRRLDRHGHSSSGFSNRSIGVVRLNIDRTSQQPQVHFSICRARVVESDGLITATYEQLLSAKDPRLNPDRLVELTGDLPDWVSAVQALCDRWTCSQEGCEGHYHLD